MVGYEPANTSIELEVSNDGGNTWLSGVFNQDVIFTTPGSRIVWKAYLNGTSSETPVLDFVSLTYSTRYQSSGYIQLRSSYYNPVSNAPVAITAFWNATTPAEQEFRLKCKIQVPRHSNTAVIHKNYLAYNLRLHLC